MASLNYSMDLGEWRRAFATVKARASDLTPVHETIGDYMVAELQGNIEAQGGVEYWPALSPYTLKRRRTEHPEAGERMLIVTRALFDSLAKDARNAYVDVGSALKKARTLFFGDKSRNIPARFPFRWRPQVLPRVGRMYLEYLFTGLK